MSCCGILINGNLPRKGV